ncbi:MAG: hypothetical protein ACHQU8_07785 [Gemmatimonadales bacterium]
MNQSLSRALTAFRIVLAVCLLYGSVETAVHGAVNMGGGHGASHFHLFLLGSIEAIGALLLLVPRLIQAGAVILVLTIAIALLVHTIRGELRPDLVIYLAGAVLVFVHERSTRTAPSA